MFNSLKARVNFYYYLMVLKVINNLTRFSTGKFRQYLIQKIIYIKLNLITCRVFFDKKYSNNLRGKLYFLQNKNVRELSKSDLQKSRLVIKDILLSENAKF